MSYSLDLRERIVAMYDDGLSADEVAATFSVHPNTVRNYVRRRDRTGSFAELPHAGAPPKKLTDEDRATLKRLHEEDNDAYLRELVERLEAACGKRVSLETIRRELEKMDLTVKKST
jgi:transposase